MFVISEGRAAGGQAPVGVRGSVAERLSPPEVGGWGLGGYTEPEEGGSR